MTTTLDTRADLSTLDAAVLCAERGLHLIPVWRATDGRCGCPRGADCISPGKHPAIDSWQTAASTDLTILRDWFASGRNNVGVVCGLSDVCVIDVDPRNGGNETFDTLVAELGQLPATVTADTGGGGKHYVFRRPTGPLVSKLGDGIEFLRDSRQFLVEPSLHPSGNLYRWAPGCAPDEMAIAVLPERWLARVRQSPPKRAATPPAIANDARIERARRYLEKIPGAVAFDGGHNQTFNAVAHVMFGFDLDEGTTYDIIANDYNPRCDPPWKERELRHKIQSCAKTCKRERGYLLQERPRIETQEQAAHHAQTAAPTDSNVEWTSMLIAKKDHTPKKGYHNVLVFVRHYPEYRGKWSLNLMTEDVWFDGAKMAETFLHDIRAHADRRLGFTPSVEDVKAAVTTAAADRPFHPIQQYLRSVDWDGIERLSAMARDYFGSDSDLHAQMVRKWMISAVARALNPGCKVDTALMLFGEQGYFKSTFFSILGGSWHADSAIDIGNKDSFQQIHAAWLYEFAELENVVHGKAESRLKAWMTSTRDLFRAPYKHTVAWKARSCVICGSTNRKQFLTDDTGSRRYWVVMVTKMIPRELLTEMRDQLWAEAVCAYEAGEPWWMTREQDADLEENNADYQMDNEPWKDVIAAWLKRGNDEMTVTEILSDALKLEPARQDRWAEMRVSRVLKELGWERRRVGWKPRRWVYVRPGKQGEMP